jgi:putative membrane protein insertion efficiency factor
MNRAQRGALWTIRCYQHATAHRMSPCRYFPSCSEYAAEAISTHGTVRGGALALRRLGRCHPLGGFGFDPVPAPRGPEVHP